MRSLLGAAETLGGILLLAPRTTTLGALVCLADMIQVFMLNMTYDVPVKLFSFHLILFSLFLLAPEANRLLGFFFTDRAVGSFAASASIPLCARKPCGRGYSSCIRLIPDRNGHLFRHGCMEYLWRRHAQVRALWHLECR